MDMYSLDSESGSFFSEQFSVQCTVDIFTLCVGVCIIATHRHNIYQYLLLDADNKLEYNTCFIHFQCLFQCIPYKNVYMHTVLFTIIYLNQVKLYRV